MGFKGVVVHSGVFSNRFFEDLRLIVNLAISQHIDS